MPTAAQINLKAALLASKAKEEGKELDFYLKQEPSLEGIHTKNLGVLQSPLKEINPHSLETLFERISLKLARGLPETISFDEDGDLKPVLHAIRAKRDVFLTEQAKKTSEDKPKRGKKKPQAEELLQLTDLSELEGDLFS